MRFDTIQFLYDYNIPVIEHSSTLTSRYIGLEECVFCGARASGNKTYAAIGKDFSGYSCWICHETNFYEAVQRLTGITNYEEIKKIYKRYGDSIGTYQQSQEKSDIIRPTSIVVPGKPELIPNARKYLIKRQYDPEFVWQKYDLRATTHAVKAGYRIVLPIKYNNRIVSWTARDYTDRQEAKFISCDKDLEIIPHKEILYNIDFAKGKNVCVVEGPYDAWRTGDGAVASFGTEITLPQLILLANRFDNIFFLFDGGESEALRHADHGATILSSMGKHAEVLEMDAGDPDEVFKDEKELIYLRKDLKLS